MSRAGQRHALLERTLESVRRQELLEERLDALRETPLAPGDLIVAEANPEVAIQWAVVGLDAAGGLLIVPADTFPALGEEDLEVVEEATGTRLNLRCRHAISVNAEAVNGELRTGTFDPGSAASAVRRIEGAASDDRSAPGDTDYRDWVEEILEPAKAAWLTTPDHEAVAPRSASAASGADGGRSWSLFGQPFGLAASVLLAVGVALVAGLGWQSWRLEVSEEARSRLEEREQTPHSLPLLFLSPGQTERGEGRAISLMPGAQRFAVVLTLDPGSLFDRYRVEIESRSAGSVWVSAPQERGETPILSIGLPRSVFPDGRYTIRLYGLDGGGAEPAGKYAFEISSAPAPGSRPGS